VHKKRKAQVPSWNSNKLLILFL